MFNIIRFMQGQDSVIVKQVRTLDEAQEICQRDETRGKGWFYGYKEVKENVYL